MSRYVIQEQETGQFLRSVQIFTIFLILGLLELFIRNVTDTICFMKDCWREQTNEKDLNANVIHSQVLVKREAINQVINLAKEQAQMIKDQRRDDSNYLGMEMLKNQPIIPPLIPFKQYLSYPLQQFCEEIMNNSLDPAIYRQSTYTFPLTKILKTSQFQEISKLAQWIEREGKLILPLAISFRATLPLELPLIVITRVLETSLKFKQLRERKIRNNEIPLILRQRPFQKKQKRLDLRIVQNKRKRYGMQQRTHRVNQQEDCEMKIFWKQQSEMQINEEIKPHSIIYFKIQKIIDATWSDNIIEKNGVETIVKVQRQLTEFMKLWRGRRN